MTEVPWKMLRDKTEELLDRVQQGETFLILREGHPEAYLIPAGASIDPEWKDIMADVWAAEKEAGPKRPNPILKERKARNYAARIRLKPSE